MSFSQIDRCAAWVLDCLSSPDPSEPLLTLSSDPQLLAGIGAFPYLHIPAIRAFLAIPDYGTAFSAVLHAAYWLRHEQEAPLPATK